MGGYFSRGRQSFEPMATHTHAGIWSVSPWNASAEDRPHPGNQSDRLAQMRERGGAVPRETTWCHDGEGGVIVDGSRLNTTPIALAYAVRKQNGICVTARSRKRDPGSQLK
jgi:hypothetical protein